jgi:lysylphosphatidylglycerol synthase-like protein
VGVLRLLGTRRAKIVFNVVSSVVAIGVGILTTRHFISNGWPLGHAKILGVVVAGGLFVAAYGFKAWGWQLLFRHDNRPATLALAAAGGAASVTGLALPGRTDEVVRISVVRKFPGRRVGIGSICLSLFLLGLIDNAALSPIAAVSAGVAAPSIWVQAGLIVVAVAGVLAFGIVVFLPKLLRHRWIARFKFVSWVAEHTTTPRQATHAWSLVSLSWVLRALAVFVLLDALSIRTSMPLALGFLCASASAAALPIAPAGGVAQAGAGAALLVAAGVHASDATAFAVAAQGLIVLAGAVVLVLTMTTQMARSRFGAVPVEASAT